MEFYTCAKEGGWNPYDREGTDTIRMMELAKKSYGHRETEAIRMTGCFIRVIFIKVNATIRFLEVNAMAQAEGGCV